MIRIPWRAWYGDELLPLSFPEGWTVRDYWPHGAPDVDAAAIEAGFDAPVDTPPLEELARGKRWVSIAVDDISRPCPAGRLMPTIMRRLERAGVDLDRVKVVMGTGTHRQMDKREIVNKIGIEAAERLDVHNNHPYGCTVNMGTSKRGTPVEISRWFAEADLRIGVGSITPHGGPGFGGGAKVVMPGVAGIATILSMHEPGRLKTGLGEVDNNELRADIEQMARDCVGLDLIVNGVTTVHRGLAGLYVGDLVTAHRAAVRLARRVYETPMPSEPVDVAICNAYPKDTDFLQHALALNVLNSSPRPVLREGGTRVIITASPEGRGFHGLYGPGMPYDALNGGDHVPAEGREPLVFFSPGVTHADVRRRPLFRRWEDLIAYLLAEHGPQASVAVFPCGATQLAGEPVSAESRIRPSGTLGVPA